MSKELTAGDYASRVLGRGATEAQLERIAELKLRPAVEHKRPLVDPSTPVSGALVSTGVMRAVRSVHPRVGFAPCGGVTRVSLYGDHPTGPISVEARATCHTADGFQRHVGIQLALQRALEGVEATITAREADDCDGQNGSQ